MWTQEKVLFSYNHNAMILILPAKMALTGFEANSLHVRFGAKNDVNLRFLFERTYSILFIKRLVLT